MLPLRVCFLWHFHQPDYTHPQWLRDGTATQFFLPWVRMHALRNYVDLPSLFTDYRVRHTINIVPSLLTQLEAYGAGATDPVLVLCTGAPSDRTPDQRRDLFSWLRTLQYATQVEPLPRLAELWHHPQPEHFTDHDVLDAQTLLHLAWSGPILRQHPTVARLLRQQRAFTIADRDELLAVQQEYIQTVVASLKNWRSKTDSECSVTPWYHPILPLVLSTDVAREAMPTAPLPDPPFQAPDDAMWHVSEACRVFTQHFGANPHGMWPAEGGLSEATLEIFAEQGIRWTATDVDVLQHSLESSGMEFNPSMAYQPYRVSTPKGPIDVLFRDHEISDAIGFTYASWDALDAVRDLLEKLRERRELIVNSFGEEALSWMCVPIILDGENCWEYYPDNGELFLRTLMRALETDDAVTSITCTEAVRVPDEHRSTLPRIVAGSWIRGTFDIWIGSPAKNTAWTLLRAVQSSMTQASDEVRSAVQQRLYLLEGSDWYWWYDDRHRAPHAALFDEMFRWHLREIYALLHEVPPPILTQPLTEVPMPQEDSMITVAVSYGAATMHESDALVEKLTLETDGNWQRLSVCLQRDCADVEEVNVTVRDRHGVERRCGIMRDETLFQSPLHDEGCERRNARTICIYLRSTSHWSVHIEEQRVGGRTATTSLDVVA